MKEPEHMQWTDLAQDMVQQQFFSPLNYDLPTL
jgi:hypothetical protein